MTTDKTNGPGFATATKPVTLHCIAFGALFEPDADGTAGGNAAMSLAAKPLHHRRHGLPILGDRYGQSVLLQALHRHPGAKTGQLQTAFTTIMDDGIAIIMVK